VASAAFAGSLFAGWVYAPAFGSASASDGPTVMLMTWKLSITIDRGEQAMPRKLAAITPGEILREEFLIPMEISQNGLARALGVPPARINDIIHGRRAVTADTASRLAIYFGTTPDLWHNLQARYDAKIAARTIVPALAKQIRPRSKHVA
jgi:addiction module HigA family antidote